MLTFYLAPETTKPSTTKAAIVETTNVTKNSSSEAEKPATSDEKPAKTKSKCVSQPIVTGKSIRGGKRAGKFKIFKNIKDMDTCVAKCCALKKQCDVAYMENNNCYSIECNRKSACDAVDLRDNEQSPQFAYMDHFLEKLEEEDAEKEIDISKEHYVVYVLLS